MAGYTCPNCGHKTGKSQRGSLVCRDCDAIWWTPFDLPKAPPSDREECFNCKANALFEIVSTSALSLYRCGKCGATKICPS